MALISLMGKDCPGWAVGQERASHTNCPGPAALPSPKPRLDLQPHSTWSGQCGVRDPAEAYASWEGCSSSTTPRDTVLLRLSSLHPWALLEVWLWRGLLRATTHLSWGPWGTPMAGDRKQAQTLAEPALPLLTLRPTAPTLHPHSASVLPITHLHTQICNFSITYPSGCLSAHPSTHPSTHPIHLYSPLVHPCMLPTHPANTCQHLILC